MSCGIVSVVDLLGRDNAVEIATEIAEGLQHRGELGVGIADAKEGMMRLLKGNGSVQEVLSPLKRLKLCGPSAIAHTRYATSGSRDPSLAQPFMDEEGTFAFGFNGNIANHAEITRQLNTQGMPIETSVDTELIRRIFIEELSLVHRRQMGEVFSSLEHQLDGSFNIALLMGNGQAYTYRNGNGNRPLAYSVVDDRYVIAASEDSAITRVFPSAKTNDLDPGHLLHAGNGEWGVENIATVENARCFFEWVYFAHYLSQLDGIPVRQARYEFGQRLAEMEMIAPNGEIVVPVPDSAETAGYGYAHKRNIPLVHAIKKVAKGRTFIAGSENREEKARRKYGLDASALDGKNIVLVDDSMVRGTTLRTLIGRLRNEARVETIHLRIACPPILAPCYYGIDISSIGELVARTQWNDILRFGVLPSHVLALLAKPKFSDQK